MSTEKSTDVKPEAPALNAPAAPTPTTPAKAFMSTQRIGLLLGAGALALAGGYAGMKYLRPSPAPAVAQTTPAAADIKVPERPAINPPDDLLGIDVPPVPKHVGRMVGGVIGEGVGSVDGVPDRSTAATKPPAPLPGGIDELPPIPGPDGAKKVDDPIDFGPAPGTQSVPKVTNNLASETTNRKEGGKEGSILLTVAATEKKDPPKEKPTTGDLVIPDVAASPPAKDDALKNTGPGPALGNPEKKNTPAPIPLTGVDDINIPPPPPTGAPPKKADDKKDDIALPTLPGLPEVGPKDKPAPMPRPMTELPPLDIARPRIDVAPARPMTPPEETVAPPPNSVTLPKAVDRKNDAYEEDWHPLKRGETFAQISQVYYNTPDYAEALQQYHNEKKLVADQFIRVPPTWVLVEKYPALVKGAKADATAKPPEIKVEPKFEPAASGSGRPAPPPAGVRPVVAEEEEYKVTAEAGETIKQIANKVFGNPNAWRKLYEANPSLDPTEPIPQGTKLRIAR